MNRRQLLPGIRAKLLVAFSALVATIALFFVLFFPARLERQAMHSVVAKANAIRDMTGYSVAAGLFFNDSASVQEVLDGVDRVDGVEFALVRDATSRLVAETPLAAAALDRSTGDGVTPDGALYVTSAPVFNVLRRVGSLRIGISLASLRDEVARAKQIGGLVGLCITLIGLFLVYAISTLVTRPLTAVVTTVDRIAAGDLTLRAAATPDAETNRLARAFNGMVDTLVGTQRELAEMNEQLEGRVSVRTAELTTAVTELEESQAALLRSETDARQNSERLQSLIDLAPEGIVEMDLEWKVKRWNQAAEQIFGWRADEVIGRPLPYLSESSNEDHARRRASVERGEASGPVETVRSRKDGTQVSVLLSAGILYGNAHQTVGYIAFLTDLTERKRLEEELRQSQKMEAVGRLAGGIAHDFNNILMVISAYTAMLLAEEKNEERHDQLEQVALAAARAAALTRQLLTFSRQDVLRVEQVDVNDVVRELEPMWRRVLRANIHLTTVLEDAPSVVAADRTQLEQVFMNMVVNAADAMPNGGQLLIQMRRTDVTAHSAAPIPGLVAGKYVNVLVQDTGTGMDAETRRRIFEPFFTTKEVGKGTGLGLATSYSIVMGLGGAIDVHTALGKGSTFEIWIPESSAPATAPAAPVVTLAPGSVSGTILIVEDTESVRTVMRHTLERKGFAVIEASDAEAALVIAERDHGIIDAVVTDLMMPGLNGREFGVELAKRFPSLGVVYISGYADASVHDPLVESREVFIQKPFSGQQLIAAISAARAAGAVRGQVLDPVAGG